MTTIFVDISVNIVDKYTRKVDTST